MTLPHLTYLSQQLGRDIHGIKDLNVGEYFDGYLVTKDTRQALAKNGNPYLNATLGDVTGTVTAMVWNITDKDIELFSSGNVLRIAGTVGEYNGNRQLNLQTYQANTDETITATDFLEQAPVPGDITFTKIVEEANKIQNETLRNLTLMLLTIHGKNFQTHPAARSLHHSYAGGLAYHTYSMLKHALVMCELYPFLNKDLLVAGTIVHDIGKIVEYESALNPATTLQGQLKGHISIISEQIYDVAKKSGVETKPETTYLQHMVLSHHGLAQNGWGSPVSPQLIEAQVLHTIDKMDAEMETYRTAALDSETETFTPRLFALDNRSFYLHGLNKT